MRIRRVFAIPLTALLACTAWMARAADFSSDGPFSSSISPLLIAPPATPGSLKLDEDSNQSLSLAHPSVVPTGERFFEDAVFEVHAPFDTSHEPAGLPAISLDIEGIATESLPPSAVISVQSPQLETLDGAMNAGRPSLAANVATPVFLVGGALLVIMTATCALLFQRPHRDLITTAVFEVQNLAYGAPSSQSAKADIVTLSKIIRRVIASKSAPEELLIPLHDLLKRCESARHATTPVTEATLINLASRSTALLRNAQQAASRRPS